MRLARTLVCCVALGSLGYTALGQDAPKPAPRGEGGRQPGGPGGGGGGGGGQRREPMSPEKAKAAWDLQAHGVAKHQGLSEDQAKTVAKAYAEARESQKTAADKQRKELMDKAREGAAGGGGRGLGPEAMKAMEDLNKGEREKFEKALVAGGLSSEQAGKLGASLGQFNPAWDVMVDTLAGFKLDAAKQQDGLNAIEEFVMAGSKARTGNPEDREANREAMQGARKKLSESLKGILDEEQMKKFESTIRGAGGRQGGRPGGPGGPGGPEGPDGGRRGGGEGGGGGGGGF